jgi:malic enzyme
VICTATLKVVAKNAGVDIDWAVIGQIILALPNPNPEIEPELAMMCGICGGQKVRQ